jgi:NuA3 HAT complex component NTO1
LGFAQDLGDVINKGILTLPKDLEPAHHVPGSDEAEEAAPAPAIDINNSSNSTVGSQFADIRERRKLGKRILKAVQPLLETSLQVESEISTKPSEGLQKELEALIDTSLDIGRQVNGTSHSVPDEGAEDTIMLDAPDLSSEPHTTVKSEPLTRESGITSNDGDVMDTAENDDDDEEVDEGEDDNDDEEREEGDSIEVNTVGLGIMTNRPAVGLGITQEMAVKTVRVNTTITSETPPNSTGSFVVMAEPSQEGPPTPPQSNGSLGNEPADPLSEGGVLWYLRALEPHGTSILEEHWAAGRDAVRTLSEDLTDLDDEDFKDLGIDMADTVTAAVLDAEESKDNSGGSSAKNKASRLRKRRASTRRR